MYNSLSQYIRFFYRFLFTLLLALSIFVYGNIYGVDKSLAATTSNLYDIGNPILSEIWIDPVNGNDNNTGVTPSLSLRTLTEAWERTENLTNSGYRLNLMPGTYSCEPDERADNCLNYFGNRRGSYQRPLIIQAVNGKHTVTIRGGFDFQNVSYLYLIDLDLKGGGTLPVNISGNNLLHIASADHLLIRGLSVVGPDCNNDYCNNLQEVLKVNQSQHIYVENSEFAGAWHSVVDYFAVQYGHFINNNLHTAGQWCMYIKGGSAYLQIEGNELHHGYLGFQAGQSSNLAVMQTPWLHYEAYDIKFFNNIMHDIEGVGMSVAGGYNILMAYNTLYNVGTDQANGFPFFQAVFGERGCSATDEIPNPAQLCQNLISVGGWGSYVESENLEAIPNKNLFIYNNIFYNPKGKSTLYTHFTVLPSRERPLEFENIPDPIKADDSLAIRGNIIWNGLSDHPLGLDSDSGCKDDNPTCNTSKLLSENSINSIEPQLTNPDGGDFRPSNSSANQSNFTAYAIPDFSWSDIPKNPVVPQGNLSNLITKDRDGVLRGSADIPGAYTYSGNNLLSDTDRIFNWLEAKFPDIINPSGTLSQTTLSGYYYRYYIGTGAYIAEKDGQLYYLGEISGWEVLNIGTVTQLLAIAVASGY
ncbi:MAG: right-handed parallel beta-helix repeat-containing protein [Desulfamplus sp.]|nr:right-handed parallel beta-helix repeat-containing protein [Desulfamplus sp.]